MVDPVQTRRFGRYELERLISRGGMGEVYLAHLAGAAGFKKPVCIKKILPHLAREQEFVDRFVDEAHIVVHLTHGNIVQVLDMGEVDGDYFIAMEYVPGRDLRDILKLYEERGEPMPLDLAIWVVGELAKALSFAHKKTDADGRPLGIIHRDVSPSNALVSREGIVKLTDFGIAKAVAKLGKSITGRLQGKFCYMSPEQAGGQSVDRRSDIFSLATVAYELITATRPFERESDLATLDAVRTADVAPPSTYLDSLPDAVDKVLLKALAKDPDDRFDDAATFARALSDAAAVDEAADEAAMAAELERLYPGGVAAEDTPRGLDLDALLSAEADALLQASPGLEDTVTQSAPRRLPSLTPQSLPQPTPQPIHPQITPSAPYEVVYAPPYNWRRGLLRAGLLIALASAVAMLLWVKPGYLLDGALTVSCEPATAEVYVDREYHGRCGVTVTDLRPGEHVVTAEMEGYDDATATVSVVRGETASVQLTLVADERVTVKIWTVDGAGQGIDGRFKIGERGDWQQSGESIRLNPGSYEVFAEAESYGPRVNTVEITAESTQIEVQLRPDEAEPTPAAPDQELIEVAATQEADSQVASGQRDTSSRSATRALRLTGFPDDAEVYVDGDRRMTGPGRLRFDEDDRDYAVSVRLAGYENYDFTHNPSRDRESRGVDLTAIRETRVVRIWVSDPAVGEVYIDGDHVGTAPLEWELEVGSHEIRVENDLAQRYEDQTVQVRPGTGPQQVTFFAPRLAPGP